jgi:hypothetical protein
MLWLIFLGYTLPFDTPIMDDIEYLQIKGLVDMTVLRPIEMDWLIPQLDDLLMNETRLNRIDRRILSRLNPLLFKDIDQSFLVQLAGVYQRGPDDLTCGFFDGRLGGRLLSNLTFAQGLRIRRASELDMLGPQPWHDFQAYLTEGFIKLKIDQFNFSVGRRNYLLSGVSDHSLLLSLDPQGYDGFLLALPGRLVEFHTIFVMLDADELRFLAVHRLGVNLRRFLKIGFGEAILFAGELEPIYLNFFMPYYLAQWGNYRNDNIMWCFDMQLHVFNSILYAELLIDDYMYEDDPYPHKLAYQVGLKSLLVDQFLMKINYTKVDKWVYTHRRAVNTYQHDGLPLGFALGNDVDKLSCSVRFKNHYGLEPTLALEYVRKGEGSIFLPYEEEGGDWNPPFPSGTVEKDLAVSLGLDYPLWNKLYLRAEVGKRFITNYNHTQGDDQDDFLLALSIRAIM